MPGRVGVDAQRLVGIVGQVREQPGTEVKGPPVLEVELVGGRHRQVQVQLLGDGAFGPGRLRQGGHLLERHLDAVSGVPQHQPVLAGGVGLAGRRRLVARPVAPAQ